MWDLYPAALQSAGEDEEDEAVGFRGASGVYSASSWGWGVGGRKRRAALEFGSGETHGRGDGLAVSRRETRARVLSGFRGLIFSARRKTVVAAQSSQGVRSVEHRGRSDRGTGPGHDSSCYSARRGSNQTQALFI